MCRIVYDCMPRMFIPLSRIHRVHRQHLKVLLISELFKLCFRHIKYTYFKLHYLYANIFWGGGTHVSRTLPLEICACAVQYSLQSEYFSSGKIL